MYKDIYMKRKGKSLVQGYTELSEFEIVTSQRDAYGKDVMEVAGLLPFEFLMSQMANYDYPRIDDILYVWDSRGKEAVQHDLDNLEAAGIRIWYQANKDESREHPVLEHCEHVFEVSKNFTPRWQHDHSTRAHRGWEAIERAFTDNPSGVVLVLHGYPVYHKKEK